MIDSTPPGEFGVRAGEPPTAPSEPPITPRSIVIRLNIYQRVRFFLYLAIPIAISIYTEVFDLFLSTVFGFFLLLPIFLVAAIFFVIRSIPSGTRLKLAAEQLAVRHFFFEKCYDWDSIHSFCPLPRKEGVLIVLELYADDVDRFAAIRHRIAAVSRGRIPNVYGLEPDLLCDLLNAYLRYRKRIGTDAEATETAFRRVLAKAVRESSSAISTSED